MPVGEVDGDLALAETALACVRAQRAVVAGCNQDSLRTLLWSLLIAAKQEKNLKDLVG